MTRISTTVVHHPHFRGAATVPLTVGAAATTFLLAGSAVILDNVLRRDGVASADRPVLSWLAAHRVLDLTVATRLVTNVADVLTVAVLGLAGALLAVALLRRAWPLLLTAVALPGAGIIILATKTLVGRQRPPLSLAVVPGATSASFPSGHTLGATVAAGVFAYIAARSCRSWRARAPIVAGAVAIAVLVGFTRVYLGAHWLTDVLGGLLIGGAWLAVCLTGCHLLLARAGEP